MPNRNTQGHDSSRSRQHDAGRSQSMQDRGPDSTRNSDRDMQPRDAEGRFTDDENTMQSTSGQSMSGRHGNAGNADQPRDAEGRFTDEDDAQSKSGRGRSRH